MYKRMLVPLDGSKLAEIALTYAKEVAGRLDVEVILLHVANPSLTDSMPMYRSYVEHAAEIVRGRAVELRQEAGVSSKIGAPLVRSEVLTGYPADEILRYAFENDVDIILMATHGWSGVKRWILGSVTDKVLRASTIPIWVVRSGVPEESIRGLGPGSRILVPLDGSELAEMVLPHVESLAQQPGTVQVDVVLISVVEPLALPASVALPEASLNWGRLSEDHLIKAKKNAEEYLVKTRDKLAEAGVSVRYELLEGRPADEIIEYAGKSQIDLIVMASHGRSGLSRWAYGSVAEKLLQSGASPILLVRPPSVSTTSSAVISTVKTLPPI
jgi:nucleotide-binding universal stress UspA family protein